MNKNTLITLLLAGLITGIITEPVFAGKRNGKVGKAPVVVPALTSAESEDLLFMREEEKLARDVYISLFSKWNLRAFNNISRSETRHMDAILSLLNKYELTDPVKEAGIFSNLELQELFDSLIATGLQSKLDAVKVGALIEEVDMEDIFNAMERTDKSDILNVYGYLLNGSTNHLIAFVSVIENMTGELYQAQYLPQELVDEILGR